MGGWIDRHFGLWVIQPCLGMMICLGKSSRENKKSKKSGAEKTSIFHTFPPTYQTKYYVKCKGNLMDVFVPLAPLEYFPHKEDLI